MYYPRPFFALLAGVFCYCTQTAMCQGNIFSPQIAKRENTVYVSVTVTEYRYVPVLTAAAHAQPTKVAQANIPVPAAAHVPSNGDALTFTSYAGLLNTIPPASYPTLWSETVPSVSAQNALKSDSSSILLTAPGHSNGQIPRPTLLTEKIFVKTTRDYRSTEHSLTTSPTRTSDTPSSTEDISSTRSLKPEKTIADNDKSSMAMTTNPESTSTDMTVSSITTRGHVTRTMTSVGSDGTTTVMTEYPLSTQKHTTQSASGAMRVSGYSRFPHQPVTGSIIDYIIDLLTIENGYRVTFVTTVGALVLSGVTMMVL